MKNWGAIFMTCILLGGCARANLAQTGGFTYVPVDPFPVNVVFEKSCQGKNATLLETLPDNAVRMLVERYTGKGDVIYGASKLGTEGESYKVIVDYINADTINAPLSLIKTMARRDNGINEIVDPFGTNFTDYVPDSAKYKIELISEKQAVESSILRPVVNIPVYVGIGLRVSANVDVIKTKANISGIGVIGAEAEAERVRGSLIVQTLGINGKAIAAALPIQSELNRTTAQNAIVAVGSIKSLLYAKETTTSPRVVGFYLPLPADKNLINAIISQFSSQGALTWKPRCKTKSLHATVTEPIDDGQEDSDEETNPIEDEGPQNSANQDD